MKEAEIRDKILIALANHDYNAVIELADYARATVANDEIDLAIHALQGKEISLFGLNVTVKRITLSAKHSNSYIFSLETKPGEVLFLPPMKSSNFGNRMLTTSTDGEHTAYINGRELLYLAENFELSEEK